MPLSPFVQIAQANDPLNALNQGVSTGFGQVGALQSLYATGIKNRYLGQASAAQLKSQQLQNQAAQITNAQLPQQLQAANAYKQALTGNFGRLKMQPQLRYQTTVNPFTGSVITTDKATGQTYPGGVPQGQPQGQGQQQAVQPSSVPVGSTPVSTQQPSVSANVPQGMPTSVSGASVSPSVPPAMQGNPKLTSTLMRTAVTPMRAYGAPNVVAQNPDGSSTLITGLTNSNASALANQTAASNEIKYINPLMSRLKGKFAGNSFGQANLVKANFNYEFGDTQDKTQAAKDLTDYYTYQQLLPTYANAIGRAGSGKSTTNVQMLHYLKGMNLAHNFGFIYPELAEVAQNKVGNMEENISSLRASQFASPTLTSNATNPAGIPTVSPEGAALVKTLTSYPGLTQALGNAPTSSQGKNAPSVQPATQPQVAQQAQQQQSLSVPSFQTQAQAKQWVNSLSPDQRRQLSGMGIK